MANNLCAQIKKPKLVANELPSDRIAELQQHYCRMSSERRFVLQRLVFRTIFSGNRFLFALVASSLTGISANILTGFLDFHEYCKTKQTMVALLLICAVVFTVSLIIMTAKIAYIQDSASNFMSTRQLPLNFNQVITARNNIIYSNCLYSITYLKFLYCISIVSGILMIIFLFWGYQIIDGAKEIIGWIKSIWIK